MLQDECYLHRMNYPTGIASYWQGSQFIDHTFATFKVRNSITSLQNEDYTQDYYTDHRPMFIQIDLAHIDGSIQIYKNPKYRRSFSKDPENPRL